MGREAGQVWRGKTREHARPGRGGCGAAGLRPAPALHPLSRVPRILSGFGATGSAASSGRRLRWRGVINAPPPGLPQACGRGHAGLSARFVLVTARPGSGQRLSARLGLGTPEPSGPAGAQGTGRAAAGSGMRLCTFSGPGSLPAPKFFPRGEPSSCVWILSLLSPRSL